jgi:hypothetical protein
MKKGHGINPCPFFILIFYNNFNMMTKSNKIWAFYPKKIWACLPFWLAFPCGSGLLLQTFEQKSAKGFYFSP